MFPDEGLVRFLTIIFVYVVENVKKENIDESLQNLLELLKLLLSFVKVI